jgi:ABC-type phosphate/phosphonate transport system substrate-binding protein
MKTVFLSSVAAAVLLFAASCGTKPADSNTAAATTTPASTTTTPASTTPAAAAPATISFVAKALPEDKDNMTPYAEIYFSYVSATKNAEIVVATQAMGEYNSVDKSSFAQLKIPAEAVAAISGFWAGLGTAYYAIEKDGKVLVFEGFQDEGMPEYTYKEVKSFDPKKLIQ